MRISYHQFLFEGWNPSAIDNPEKKRFHQGLNRYISAAERAEMSGKARPPSEAELEHVARTEHNTSYNLMSREDRIRMYKKVHNRVARTGQASDIPMPKQEEEQE